MTQTSLIVRLASTISLTFELILMCRFLASDSTTPRPFTFNPYNDSVSRGNATTPRPNTFYTHTDDISTTPASVFMGLSYLDQTDDSFSTSGYGSASAPPVTNFDPPQRMPPILQGEFPPEKWRGGPSGSMASSNGASEVIDSVIDSPPAYPGSS